MPTSKQSDVKEILFHDSNPPKDPTIMLAGQLERMINGTPTAVVFSYATELPKEFDPCDVPAGMTPAQAKLVDRFYRLQTSRECPVYETNSENVFKKKCTELSLGFREIITHQEVKHDRRCHYLCLIDNCLAPFDKIGNAKRHCSAYVVNKSNSGAMILELPKDTRKLTHHFIKLRRMHSLEAVKRRQERLQKRHSTTTARNITRREVVESPRINTRISKISLRPRSTRRVQNLSLLPEIQSLAEEDVRMKVSSSREGPLSSTDDVGRLRNENIVNDTLRGECQTQTERERVAAMALVDLWYGAANVAYEFS